MIYFALSRYFFWCLFPERCNGLWVCYRDRIIIAGEALPKLEGKSVGVHTSRFFSIFKIHLSLVVRKPGFGVSVQVQHKLGCAVTEDG